MPPAIITRPGTGVTTVCSREMRDVGSRPPRSSGRSPAYTPTDVVVVERLAQQRVDVVEQVVDVGAAGGGVGLVEVPVGVGGADDPVRPHGITNSTEVSVRAMKPASDRIRSRGTTRWMPLLAWTLRAPRPPIISWISSVQTPAALTTTLARTSKSRPGLEVDGAYADHPLALAQETDHACVRVATWAPWLAAVRATASTSRASSTWAS